MFKFYTLDWSFKKKRLNGFLRSLLVSVVPYLKSHCLSWVNLSSHETNKQTLPVARYFFLWLSVAKFFKKIFLPLISLLNPWTPLNPTRACSIQPLHLPMGTFFISVQLGNACSPCLPTPAHSTGKLPSLPFILKKKTTTLNYNVGTSCYIPLKLNDQFFHSTNFPLAYKGGGGGRANCSVWLWLL